MLYESFAGFKPDPANYQSIEAIRPDCKGLDSVIQHAIAGEHERIVSAEKFSRALINLNNEL